MPRPMWFHLGNCLCTGLNKPQIEIDRSPVPRSEWERSYAASLSMTPLANWLFSTATANSAGALELEPDPGDRVEAAAYRRPLASLQTEQSHLAGQRAATGKNVRTAALWRTRGGWRLDS
jgi:hypothetical protein